MLLNDLLKQTPQSNKDYGALEKALSTIKEVMTHINEDKRRTEILFELFNDIENCPVNISFVLEFIIKLISVQQEHIVSLHHSFVSQCDVIELLGDGIIGRGEQLTLFLFSDVIGVKKNTWFTFEFV